MLFAGEYINLAQLSLLAAVDRPYLSKIFSGKQYPSMKVARRIAYALNIRLDIFIEELDRKTAPYSPSPKFSTTSEEHNKLA